MSVTGSQQSNMLVTMVPIIPEHIWSRVSGEDAATKYTNPIPSAGDSVGTRAARRCGFGSPARRMAG